VKRYCELRCLGGRRQVLSWALFLLALVTVLGGAPLMRQSAGEACPTAARVIYESEGEVTWIDALGRTGDRALIWEAIPQSTRSTRLLQLDPTSGSPRVLHEGVEAPLRNHSNRAGITEDGGRAALIGTQMREGAGDEDELLVTDDFRNWAVVATQGHRGLICPRWNPDGSALAFLSVDTGRSGMLPVDVAVVPVPLPAPFGAARVLTSPGDHATGAEWSADGKRLFLAVYRPDRHDSYIESVDWPLLRRRMIKTAKALGNLSVAHETGEVVFAEDLIPEAGKSTPNAHTHGVLWRLSPDGTLSKTSVQLDDKPRFAVAVSPDGKHFAVVPSQEGNRLAPWGRGLVVFSLADGTRHVYQELAKTPIISVAWVLGGRALLVAEQGKRVWLVEMDAAIAPGTS